jgi:hypothetical protein
MSTANSTDVQPPRQSSIYPTAYLVGPADLTRPNICPAAKSLLYRIVGGDGQYLVGLTCKRWGCRYCAQQKIRKLSWLTSGAKPTRLLTLTVDPKLYSSPREAFDRTRAFVPELIRALRVRFGEIEYMRVTELTKAGYPHYHLLIRSGFLPHAVVKKLWEAYTGATIVDLRQVTDRFGAYNYLTKYLTKLHKIEWTERHVSYSKSFFQEDPKNTWTPAETADPVRDNRHPLEYLEEHFLNSTIVQEAPMRWLLSDAPASLSGPRPDGF